MGRSQVLRNQRGRGRGRGRGGGEGRGRGDSSGGGGGRGGGRSRHKGGVDPRKLGDNAFRFERATSNNSSGGGDSSSHYDGLLDEINFVSSGGRLGEYYGDSHYAANDEEEGLADATLSAATAAFSGGGRNKQQHSESEVEDNFNWMTIDVKALDKSLRRIPIQERLKLPIHIGEHLEDMYGKGGGGDGRKKTLAELREESKVSSVVDSSGHVDSSKPNSKEERDQAETKSEEDDSAKISQPDDTDNGDASDGGADDDDEDLEAWLDDMIA